MTHTHITNPPNCTCTEEILLKNIAKVEFDFNLVHQPINMILLTSLEMQEAQCWKGVTVTAVKKLMRHSRPLHILASEMAMAKDDD